MMRALRGRRIVVTRPRERADALVAALEAEGAEVILAPTIEVVPVADLRPLRVAATRLGGYDWLVFTSAYAVEALVGAGAEPASARRVGCVGEATAEAASAAGFRVSLVPADATGAALAEALIGAGAGKGTRVLFPCAADAREELRRALRGAGVEVDDVIAYTKRVPAPDPALTGALAAGAVHAVTFTSPSTARNFVRLYGPPSAGTAVIVIGATTAAAAREAGMRVDGMARESSAAGIVRAAVELLGGPE